jgi:hypothetical protein
MYCKIDYLSFTVEFPEHLKGSCSDERLIASAIASSVFSGRILSLVVSDDWQIYKGGKFYVYRAMDTDSKLSLSFDTLKPYATVELSGQTCEIIRDGGAEDELLHLAKERVTRIDLAVDFETDVRPVDFLSNGYNPVFKARSHITDIAGETEYVGSWNSERFARIYRYNDPHPRSHLLRVEHVYRSQWAKAVVPLILEKGVVEACLSAGKAFGWMHPLWDRSGGEISRLTAPRSTPSQASKYRWLTTQVAPAIRAAISEGWFDFDQWVREQIYNSK